MIQLDTDGTSTHPVYSTSETPNTAHVLVIQQNRSSEVPSSERLTSDFANKTTSAGNVMPTSSHSIFTSLLLENATPNLTFSHRHDNLATFPPRNLTGQGKRSLRAVVKRYLAHFALGEQSQKHNCRASQNTYRPVICSLWSSPEATPWTKSSVFTV